MKSHTPSADDYAADLAELRARFAAVDTRKPDQLRQWFTAHQYLRTHEHARVAGVCLKTICRWRRRAGFRPAGPWRAPGWRRPASARPAPLPTAIWDNREWLEAAYASGLSLATIATRVGRTYTAVRRRFVRYNIARRAVAGGRPAHPCCTAAWLSAHYVDAALSLGRCASLAGVSRYTIVSWLTIHGIAVREYGETIYLRRRRRYEAALGATGRR